MYKEVAQHIPNVSIYPIVSLVIFFSFFLILLLIVITKDKKIVDTLKHMPIDDQKTEQ
jgi:type II secretory pathway component PulF